MGINPHANPLDGEPFYLTLERPIDGLEFVRLFHGTSDGCVYKGEVMTGPFTCYFMLKRLGVCRDLDEVRAKHQSLNKIPQGQWLWAFFQAYPHLKGEPCIGIADLSWSYLSRHPKDSGVYFPMIAYYMVGSGRGLFPEMGSYGDHYRWLTFV